MSFKDLERAIQAALDEYNAKAKAKADKRLKKQLRTAENKALAALRGANAKRGGLYIPAAPPAKMRVTLNVRKVLKGGSLGDLEEVVYDIPTFSESLAEHQARTRAKNDGYTWRGTVSIESLS